MTVLVSCGYLRRLSISFFGTRLRLSAHHFRWIVSAKDTSRPAILDDTPTISFPLASQSSAITRQLFLFGVARGWKENTDNQLRFGCFRTNARLPAVVSDLTDPELWLASERGGRGLPQPHTHKNTHGTTTLWCCQSMPPRTDLVGPNYMHTHTRVYLGFFVDPNK